MEREAKKITPEARNWWSFRKPVKPAAPAVKNQDQVRTPIDAFVLAQLEEKGWKLQPEADRTTLDPPRLLRPDRPAADARRSEGFRRGQIPERLGKGGRPPARVAALWRTLGTPLAGCGRLLRFRRRCRGQRPRSGLEVSRLRHQRVQQEQAVRPVPPGAACRRPAGQLQAWQPPTPEQIEPLTATGFLRTTADITDNQTIYEVDKYFDAQEKAMETSLKAVLGVTIQCARCHDHKFDPILQQDYYKLMAVFQAVWDPENWLAANIHSALAEPHGARYGPEQARGVDQGCHQQRRKAIPPAATPPRGHLRAVPRAK